MNALLQYGFSLRLRPPSFRILLPFPRFPAVDFDCYVGPFILLYPVILVRLSRPSREYTNNLLIMIYVQDFVRTPNRKIITDCDIYYTLHQMKRTYAGTHISL